MSARQNTQVFTVEVFVPARTRVNRITNETISVKEAHTARVEVTIDLDSIRRGIALSAAKNKTGRSVVGGGTIVAKLIR